MSISHSQRLKGKERRVSFRDVVQEIPSTTYGTFALYRYPAKFIPQVIYYVLKTYAKKGMSIFDPFAGYGTVGLVARIFGLDYELWDLNPLLKHIHPIATMEPIALVNRDGLLACIASSREEFVPDWSRLSYWFPEEFLPLLFKAWGFYHSLSDGDEKKILLVPLLKVTRYFSYNDEQRQKLSRSPLSEARIARLRSQDWQKIFFQMLADEIDLVARRVSEYWTLNPKSVKAIVKGGVDALEQDVEKEHHMLITSPPYLQSQEYIRGSKIDLFWLGYSESFIKELSKKEIPYREVEPCPIYSETYFRYLERVKELHLRRLFERYFWGVLGALTRLRENIRSYLCLFVGRATIRTISIPIDRIFVEHFEALGWKHEITLIDPIRSRRLFASKVNPATGLRERRLPSENLVILRRRGE